MAGVDQIVSSWRGGTGQTCPAHPSEDAAAIRSWAKHLIALEPELLYRCKQLQNKIVQLNPLPSVFCVLDHSEDVVMYLETTHFIIILTQKGVKIRQKLTEGPA